jgi:hypothetical protein
LGTALGENIISIASYRAFESLALGISFPRLHFFQVLFDSLHPLVIDSILVFISLDALSLGLRR